MGSEPVKGPYERVSNGPVMTGPYVLCIWTSPVSEIKH